jgi:topoisomerase-4 subunit B
MRVEPVVLDPKSSIQELLSYYMGKNTPQRQEFIIENLRFDIETEEENPVSA